MSQIFWSGFWSMFDALAVVFIVIIAAGLLVRKNIVTDLHIESLSKITVVVLMPAMIFSNTLISFKPEELPAWWLLPLLGIGMSLGGMAIALLLFADNIKKHRSMIAVSSLQNAGYLVLPIGQVVYPEHFQEFALITFLFILGYNPLLWSLGKYLSTSSEVKVKITARSFITAPAIANVLSLLVVLLGLKPYFPKPFIDSADLLGKATVPIAIFVLGATLGSVSLRKFPSFIDILRVTSIRYMFIPAATVAVLYAIGLGKTHPLLADFFVIQSAAAPATAIMLQVRAYGGDRQKTGSMMLLSYVFCLVALPFWIALWHIIN